MVSVIDQIDKAVAVIPRGALYKTPFGPIHVNRTFEGELSRAPLMGRTCLFPSMVRHIPGLLGKLATSSEEEQLGPYHLERCARRPGIGDWHGLPSHWTPTLFRLKVLLPQPLATWIPGFVWGWAPSLPHFLPP